MTNEKIKGTISRVSNKDGNFGIQLQESGSDVWYNGYGEAGCKMGDKVDVEYVINGQWKNVKKLEVLESSPEKPDTALEASRRRHATDCVLKSADMIIAGKISRDELESEAKRLFKAIDTITKTETDEE